jgi:hypothetical protein
MLEYVNRGRMDPVGEGERVARAAENPRWAWWAKQVDWARYREEMSRLAPVPPLVFDLALLKAARRHSHYLLLNMKEGDPSGHDETPGLPGFTGVGCNDRVFAAGYPKASAAENIGYVADIHMGYCRMSVDYNSRAEDGMRPGRGHRKNMHAAHSREFGFAVMSRGDDRLRTGAAAFATHLFGSHCPPVSVGGVVYEDRNGNAFYDPGEGAGGIEIRVEGGNGVRSWKSGAWAMDLTGDGPWRLVADWDGLVWSREIPADSGETVKFDVIRPPAKVLAGIDKKLTQLAEEAQRRPKGHKVLKLGLELLEIGVRIPLDDRRRETLARLTAPAADRLAKAKTEVRAALGDSTDDSGPRIRGLMRAFRGTGAAVWFEDAEACARQWDKVRALLAKLDELRPNRRERTAADLRDAAEKLSTPEWRTWMQDLASRIAP